MTSTERTFTAFAGHRKIAAGSVREVLVLTMEWLGAHAAAADAPLLVFEDRTGEQIDFDLRGTAGDALERLAEHPLFRTEQGVRRAGPGARSSASSRAR